MIYISGYWQVEVSPDDSEKAHFCALRDLFLITVILFGLRNATATFQRLMDCALSGCQGTSCLVYFDGTNICTSFKDHLQSFLQVFDRLKHAGLKLHPSNCQFQQHKVHFWGRIVSDNGVSPNPLNTVKVKEWPTPTTAQET